MQIVSIAVSQKKGTRKTGIEKACLIVEHGIEGDAHAGDWHRQVSLLAQESIEKMRAKGLDVTFGDFAENIATTGVNWVSIPVGSRVQLGDTAILEITQIGKACRNKCAIYYQAGDCVMPKEGVFGKVITGGDICVGDAIEILTVSSKGGK